MNLIFNPILATWQILGRGQRLTKENLAPKPKLRAGKENYHERKTI